MLSARTCVQFVVDTRPASAAYLVSFPSFQCQEFGKGKEKQVLNSTWTLRDKSTSMSHEWLIFMHPRLNTTCYAGGAV
jgi:hypothetical protein